LEYEVADRYGIYMAREVIGLAERVIVHSRYAAQIARLEAPPGDEGKIEVLGFGVPDPAEFPPVKAEGPVIGTFGLVAEVKQVEKVLDAFALLAGRRLEPVLTIVGPPVGDEERVRYAAQAERLGI